MKFDAIHGTCWHPGIDKAKGGKLVVFLLLLVCSAPVMHAVCLTDPIMQGQDPAVVLKDNLYHLVQSDGCNIHLRRSTTIGGLAAASDSIIYSPGCSDLWAPEIHWLNNRWYLYYTWNTNPSTGGRDRRGFVAESQGVSPFGPYINRGILFNDYWNIDGNVVSWGGQLYYLFSGEPVPGSQNIYIAPMSNPYALSGPPVMISQPTESWETIGNPNVNEGPWGFQRDGRLFVVYSASGCWTDDYALGLLTLTGSNPLSITSWTKSGPVFTRKPGAYGPGHNCVVQSPAGEWWNIYHANDNSGEGCGGFRKIRAQRIFWQSDNTPAFGSPVPIGSLITEDADVLVTRFPLNQSSGITAVSTVCQQTGSLSGGTIWAQPGLMVNGVNGHLNCGAAVGNDVQNALTLAAWVRADAFPEWAGIITKGITVSPYALQIGLDGAVRFSANWGGPSGGVGAGSWDSSAKLRLAQWQHVAVTYDGDRVRFYIDGVLDVNQPRVGLQFGVSNEALTMGADFPGGDEFFSGTILDARVYGRALLSSEIQALVNHAPVLAPTPDVDMVGGQTLIITNTASDPEVPPQILTYHLLSAPVGSFLNPLSGVFQWPSTVSDAPSTNLVTVRVQDNGILRLSDTQSFTIHARPPVDPVLSDPAYNGSSFHFEVNGDPGLDYALWGSTNLYNWSFLSSTNSSSVPFRLVVPEVGSNAHSFYRLQIQ